MTAHAARRLTLLAAAAAALAVPASANAGGGTTTLTDAPCASAVVNNPFVSVNRKASVTLTWNVTDCSTQSETLHGVLNGTCTWTDSTGATNTAPTVTQRGPDLALRSRDTKSFSLQLASNPNCPLGTSGTRFDYVMSIQDPSGIELTSVRNTVQVTLGF